jgi:hypothetical protein
VPAVCNELNRTNGWPIVYLTDCKSVAIALAAASKSNLLSDTKLNAAKAIVAERMATWLALLESRLPWRRRLKALKPPPMAMMPPTVVTAAGLPRGGLEPHHADPSKHGESAAIARQADDRPAYG